MKQEMTPALREALEKLARNRIRVEYRPGEEPFRLGASKFGGKPHLPADFDWPWYHGEKLAYDGKEFSKVKADCPLSFLLQIDLGELTPLDRDGLLPKDGLLSFFYELDSQPWGYSPAHGGGGRVYWFPAGTPLAETGFPAELEEDFHLPELALELEAAPCLPDWSDLEILAPELQEQLEGAYDRYDEMKKELGCPSEFASHLLGYPDLIQNPMAPECEQVARGYDCGRGPLGLSPEEQAEIDAAAKDWILLFQMGTVDDGEDFELMYGDCGCLYFWIRRQDLADRAFHKAWALLQCG